MTTTHAAASSQGALEFPGMRVHCLGIGGIGMSGVARLLAGKGAIVSGCDAQNSVLCDRLRDAGIQVEIGHDPSHLKGMDCFVTSTAVHRDNAEYAAAIKSGIPVLHRSQALALVSKGATFIAVAGTHGKTTTSSMLAMMLEAVGRQPSFAVGGIIAGIDSNARYVRPGEEGVFVAEADESDGSFLVYDVDLAIVTNIEADHLDYYGTPAKVEAAFEDFVRKIPEGGTAVMCLDDAGVLKLLRRFIESPVAAKVVGYGNSDPTILDEEIAAMMDDYYQIDEVPENQRTAERSSDRPCAIIDSRFGPAGILICTSLPGRHNLSNATAVFIVSQILGVGAKQACDAIADFPGVARRFELKGEICGVSVYDDYAHHPTEVEAALRGARTVAGCRRLHVIFQPHLYSRTQEFAAEFAQALDNADRVLVLDIYGARETPAAGVDSQLITSKMKHATNNDPDFPSWAVPGDDAATSMRFMSAVQPGDIVMTVGAGDVTRLGPLLLKELSDKMGGAHVQ